MKITRDDLNHFLTSLDQALKTPVSIALMEIPTPTLVYFPRAGLEQAPVDLFQFVQSAHTLACSRTKIQIPLRSLGIADFPYLFETRLSPGALPPMKNLHVDLVDRHDTVVSKILRGEKRELSEIAKMGRQAGVSYSGLIDSFCAIDTSVGEISWKKQQFLELIQLLFGDTSVIQAEAVLAERLGT